jgi:hypothetical protein
MTGPNGGSVLVAEFSENEEPLVMRLFVKDIAITQTYITATKKSRRTAFIRSFLEDAEL